MANMTDLDSFRNLSYHSYFKTRTLIILELAENIFDPVPISPVKFEPSIINEMWPRSNVFSDVNFTLNSPLPCFLSGIIVKPTGVLKLFSDYLNLTWEHVKIIPSRPLTIITKGTQYAVTRNFANFIQADMDFSNYLSPYWFLDQVVTNCIGLILKRP